MKKRQINNMSKASINKKSINADKRPANITESPLSPNDKLSFVRVLYLGVFLIVLLSAVFLALFPGPEMQFSPPASNSGMSYETASSFLEAMSQQGIDWYCGKVPTYTDKQSITYGFIELTELKKILQNDELLRQAFCD